MRRHTQSSRNSGVAHVAILLALGLVLAAACSSSAYAGRAADQTLTIAYGTQIQNLDPVVDAGAASGGIFEMVTESLTTYTYKGTTAILTPLLATSWKGTQADKVWTFSLRKGVKFSDGEPFNAAAVKFTIDRLLSPATPSVNKTTLGVIQQTKVINNYTVQFDLSQPYPQLPEAMSYYNASIIAPGAASRAPNTPQHLVTPIGTGPYVYSGFVPNSMITLTRNPKYWGARPYYAKQVVQMVPVAATQEAELLSGQADVIENPPAPDVPTLRSNKSYKLVQAPSGFQIWFGINTTRVPQLRNPSVRQALNYAVNRQAIVNSILFGLGSPASSSIQAGLFGFCSVGSYGYNPTKAKQLLAAAGASNMSLTMQAPSGHYIQDYAVAQAVAGDLRAIGLSVTLLPAPDYATYSAGLHLAPTQVKADISMQGFGAAYPDASSMLDLWLTDMIYPKGLSNPWGFTDQYYDGDVAIGDHTVVQKIRAKAYCAAQKEIWKQAPLIFMYTQRSVALTTASLKGVFATSLWLNTTYAKPS
jgi:ABC-type transport system substrate-binding protein